ncbi:MAG: hypothetical protein J6M64_10045, partial [Oscillospiraceae bacterium]|nr:hypothetical protein [Oscillospiraceae bacterium]
EKPWNVGPEHFPESVQAWLTGEDNRKTLHINGSGAMNSFSVNDRPPFDNGPPKIRMVGPRWAPRLCTVNTTVF